MNKKNQHNRSCVGAVVIGTVLAFLATLLSALIIAICINGEYIGIDRIKVSSHIVHVVGTFLGCLVAAILCPGKRFATTFMTAGGYLCFLIISACLFCDRVGEGAAAGVCSIVLSVLSVLFLVQHKKKTRILRTSSSRRNG